MKIGSYLRLGVCGAMLLSLVGVAQVKDTVISVKPIRREYSIELDKCQQTYKLWSLDQNYIGECQVRESEPSGIEQTMAYDKIEKAFQEGKQKFIVHLIAGLSGHGDTLGTAHVDGGYRIVFIGSSENGMASWEKVEPYIRNAVQDLGGKPLYRTLLKIVE